MERAWSCLRGSGPRPADPLFRSNGSHGRPAQGDARLSHRVHSRVVAGAHHEGRILKAALVENDGGVPWNPPCADASSIVERLRGGSSPALGEAYDLYHEPLRAFARRLLGDDAAAEDLVQETFIALPKA